MQVPSAKDENDKAVVKGSASGIPKRIAAQHG